MGAWVCFGGPAEGQGSGVLQLIATKKCDTGYRAGVLPGANSRGNCSSAGAMSSSKGTSGSRGSMATTMRITSMSTFFTAAPSARRSMSRLLATARRCRAAKSRVRLRVGRRWGARSAVPGCGSRGRCLRCEARVKACGSSVLASAAWARFTSCTCCRRAPTRGLLVGKQSPTSVQAEERSLPMLSLSVGFQSPGPRAQAQPRVYPL
jgi:hypothetical protein